MGGLPLLYAVSEVAVAVMAVVGNSLVLIAFGLERPLRRVTNFYIFSLSLSDVLVGLLGIPSAILTMMGKPREAFFSCLLMLSVLVLLCTVSILNLVAVTLDRYWAIIYPFSYRRIMSKRAALWVILCCWVLGTVIGLLPLFGWNNGPEKEGLCLFIPVMHYNFLVFIFFATIVCPALLMAFCYGRIYAVVLKQVRQIAALEHQLPRSAPRTTAVNGGGSVSGSERSLQQLPPPLHQQASKREVRTAKNLAIIVIFFMICWVPLYTVNCVQAFCEKCRAPEWLLDVFIVLSHANSAINPFLYAYHMSDFRLALRRHFLCSVCERTEAAPVPHEMESLSVPALTKMAVKMAPTENNTTQTRVLD